MHIMLDIETLGTYAGAAIVSIGVCKFYKQNDEIKIHPDTFYTNVSPTDCKKYGLFIENSTIEWWAKQSKEARNAWMINPQPLKDSLIALSNWWGSNKQLAWCNGMNFDFPILEVAYRKVEYQSPWHYQSLNDFRTLINVLGLREEFKQFTSDGSIVKHNALDDAIAQAKFLGKYISEIL